MNRILGFDGFLRRVISYLYRIILILYSVCILTTFDNYFKWYIYLNLIIIYAFCAYTLIPKDGMLSKLRLFLDYIFIYIVLFEKHIDNLPCCVFLLMPIFNSPNHSGAKRSYWVLFITPLLCYIVLSGFKIEPIFIYPFLFLFLITLLENVRNNIFKFYYSLTNTISIYNESRKKAGKDYKIYHSLINKLNSSKFSKICHTDKIICLKLINKNFSIINSSVFIAEFEIKNRIEFDKQLRTKDVFSDIEIVVDKKTYNSNIIIPVIVENKTYCFIVITQYTNHLVNSFSSIRDHIFLSPFLSPLFKQLVLYFESEFEFKKNRKEKFEKIKDEYEYVLRTINAIHFIRNRLTPFKNYLYMASDYELEKDIDLKKVLNKLLLEENNSAKSALSEILNRANQILEEGANPFNVTSDIGDIQIQGLFSELRILSSEMFGSNRIENDLQKEQFDYNVSVSNKGIHIVFSDILNNIRKYYNGEYAIRFEIFDNNLIISFENNFHPIPINLDNIKKLIKYFNSEENYNIFKMTTKGAFLMKDFLRQMDIKLEVSLNEEKSLFTSKLTFKIK